MVSAVLKVIRNRKNNFNILPIFYFEVQTNITVPRTRNGIDIIEAFLCVWNFELFASAFLEFPSKSSQCDDRQKNSSLQIRRFIPQYSSTTRGFLYLSRYHDDNSYPSSIFLSFVYNFTAHSITPWRIILNDNKTIPSRPYYIVMSNSCKVFKTTVK